jgi:pSer/pThr/pTyr-binding forkhead associated (FHA) protein/thioredoxin reductase
VPRRFDIPGNTDGIAYRLTDAAAYVGDAALVIGGGTSAAEAVIAVSNAKVRKGDSSAVYWSYRGDKLPKVSKAMADTFFEAYLGNGNIRYLPNSEPVAVVAAEPNQEFLSLRIDRKALTGRPNETTHLEFRKEQCMACIGEDIPEGFLNSLGIFMATGGPTNKKRMVVTPILETQQPNIYLIGDILSQAYLETEDFSGDPAMFREVKHRGNIKAALRDGVLVAKVAAQRVSGKKEFDIELDFVEEEKEAPVEKSEVSALATIFAQSPKKATEVPPKENETGSFLVRILPGGVQEEEFQLKEFGVTTIGRKFCDIVVPDDEGLSDRHASISHEKNGFFLRDDGSAAGVFLRFADGGTISLDDGDLLRVGRQFLLFKIKEGDASFTHYNLRGERVDWYPLPERTIVVGRDAPDVVLDQGDGSLSRRHLSLAFKDGKIVARDLKSLNGTYLKVRDTVRIDPGMVFRIGRQTFMLALQQGKPQEKVRVSTRVSQAPPQAKAAVPPVPAGTPTSLGTVTFKNTGKTVTFEKGETLCDIAEKNGLKIVAECHAGICGSDPVRILAGGQGLTPPTAEEKGTLEDICGLQPGECRLACMVRPTGRLEVEVL